VTPGGELITLNGTIEEVHAELLRLNSNWDEDFLEEPTDLAKRDFDSADLEKRTDFTNSKCNCFGPYGLAKSIAINQGITYLRKVKGKPRASAGLSRCWRVSCSYDSGIYWCNDVRRWFFLTPGSFCVAWCHSDYFFQSKSPKMLNSFGSIADGAQYIATRCKRGSGVSQYTAGNVFHKTNWNVIVREDNC
jgi:hypothetical protein